MPEMCTTATAAATTTILRPMGSSPKPPNPTHPHAPPTQAPAQATQGKGLQGSTSNNSTGLAHHLISHHILHHHHHTTTRHSLAIRHQQVSTRFGPYECPRPRLHEGPHPRTLPCRCQRLPCLNHSLQSSNARTPRCCCCCCCCCCWHPSCCSCCS